LNKKIFLILPIIIFNAIFFFGSFIIGIFSSFGNHFYENGWFIDQLFILFNEEIINSIIFTLKISAFSTFISLTVALILLFIVFNHSTTKKIVKKILYLPLLTPYLLIAFFMMYAFSTSGLFNRLLFSLGIVTNLSDGFILINDLGGKGIILTYIWKTTPFILLVLLNSLDHFDFRLLTIAESLGSSKAQSFYNIIWPHINSSFFYSGIIVFTFIFSAVEIPLILGPTRPQTLGHWAFQNFQNGEIIFRSRSLAIGTVILCLNIIITLFVGYKLLGQVNYEKNH
jgi:putative spermidine/putrescine transport system permease protein